MDQTFLFSTDEPQGLEEEIEQAIEDICLAAGSDVDDPVAAIEQNLMGFTATIADFSKKNCISSCKQVGKACSNLIKKSTRACINTVLSFISGLGSAGCAEEEGRLAKECRTQVKDFVKGEKARWKAATNAALGICTDIKERCEATCR